MSDLLEWGYKFNYNQDKLFIDHKNLPFPEVITINRSADRLYRLSTDQFVGMCNLFLPHHQQVVSFQIQIHPPILIISLGIICAWIWKII